QGTGIASSHAWLQVMVQTSRTVSRGGRGLLFTTLIPFPASPDSSRQRAATPASIAACPRRCSSLA
ncbi:MAG: hypothetical protein ACK559_25775, partial [bacterium]